MVGAGVMTGVSAVAAGDSVASAFDEGSVISDAGDADKAGILVFVPPAVKGSISQLSLVAVIAPITSFESKANRNASESDAVVSCFFACSEYRALMPPPLNNVNRTRKTEISQMINFSILSMD